jgi:hypothetical protein
MTVQRTCSSTAMQQYTQCRITAVHTVSNHSSTHSVESQQYTQCRITAVHTVSNHSSTHSVKSQQYTQCRITAVHTVHSSTAHIHQPGLLPARVAWAPLLLCSRPNLSKLLLVPHCLVREAPSPRMLLLLLLLDTLHPCLPQRVPFPLSPAPDAPCTGHSPHVTLTSHASAVAAAAAVNAASNPPLQSRAHPVSPATDAPCTGSLPPCPLRLTAQLS